MLNPQELRNLAVEILEHVGEIEDKEDIYYNASDALIELSKALENK